jgi:hypothetical protein
MKLNLFLNTLRQNENNIPIQLFYAEQVDGEKQYETENLQSSQKHQTNQYLFRFPFLKTF